MSIDILIILYFMYIYKRKKVHTKKEIYLENQNFIELLPGARLPPVIKILSVLLKIS